MEPAPHVPPCEGGEISAEQQAVVDRYLERQATRSVAKCPIASLNYQAINMSLTNFVDQMGSAFPSLSDFNVTALKWADLDQDVVYQITSTRAVNTQHGQSVILSLQKADGSRCSAWACGMLSKGLLQNPMIMVSSRYNVIFFSKRS